MIRLFIYSLAALGIGAALALLLAADPGYVLISIRGTTVEATLAAIVISLLLIIVLGITLVWLLRLLNPVQLFRHNWFGGKSIRYAGYYFWRYRRNYAASSNKCFGWCGYYQTVSAW